MKRMSKMEAVGALCEIKKQYVKQLDSLRERLEEQVEDDPYSALHAGMAEDYERWIRALEMAGTAMTR